MDDTYDERSADEQGGAASGAVSGVPPFAGIPPSEVLPDQDTQILDIWFATGGLRAHLDQLEQQIDQVTQDVATIQEHLVNIRRQLIFQGRPITQMIADICFHLGFAAASGAPLD